ncbi:MAG: homoserine O-acetyltransferase [Candidatus Aureabacteria bacterium]|nr:homoserine O-acetyltransferase [Candidatus Auribacterota bacterium]
MHNDTKDSVGLVRTQTIQLKEKISLDCGTTFGPITVAYETYGRMNEAKSNVILVLHALSGSAHAAGYWTPEDKKPGWWDMMIGPGKALDTNLYCVICSNVLGGCYGTTGPSSINPNTQQPYAMSFPVISISDMVTVQKQLMDQLEIPGLLAIIGGSMGGMQVLEWAVNYPGYVKGAIPIASTARLSAQSIAFNEVGRRAIMADPKWNNGNYDPKDPPARGLEIARMVGHITYLSDESMQKKFGRRLKDTLQYSYDFDPEFEVESYLRYQGKSFVKRFDANAYLYITKAMDYFDIAMRTNGSLEELFKNVTSSFLVMAFSSDWLFPSYQSKAIAKALRTVNKEVTYVEIKSSLGHDAFLLEHQTITHVIKYYLKHLSDGNKK